MQAVEKAKLTRHWRRIPHMLLACAAPAMVTVCLAQTDGGPTQANEAQANQGMIALTQANQAMVLNQAMAALPQSGQPRVEGQDISVLPVVTEGLDTDGTLKLVLNRSRLLMTGVRLRSAERDGAALTAGSSDIITATPVSPNSIMVTAKKLGSTNLILEDELGRRQLVEVLVEADLQGLRTQLRGLDAGAAIDAGESNGTIVLHGRVPNLKLADQAAQIAAAYTGSAGKVVNLLEVSGGQQVMLEVKFAEVSKSVESDLGVNFAYTDGTTFVSNNIGQINPFGTSSANLFTQALSASAVGSGIDYFGNLKFNKSAFAYFISCLRQNDLMRTLAEPNLTAISGETASFQVGGQVPIPVPQQGSGGSGTVITIQYENYGVLLHFTPVVLGDGRIRLKIDPEVSDLDYSHGVSIGGFVIPGFTTNTVDTTVELADGQTLTIAGLLNNQMTATADSTPGLGDLPVLGSLFRSVDYQRKQTELVVMVTPRLVEAMNPDGVPSAPGEHWRYPSEADIFLNRDLGGEASAQGTPATGASASAKSAAPPPRFQGQYGFTPTADTFVVEP